MNGENRELELYVHIPFCVRKCGYCDFLSGPAEEDTRNRYLAALKQEIRQTEEAMRKRRIVSIFFGGGTPSLLTGGQLSEILETIEENFRLEGGL